MSFGARLYCFYFIHICFATLAYGNTTETITTKPNKEVCKDKLETCFYYDDVQCLGIYTPWAKENCAYRCGYCEGSHPPCEDKITFCKDLGAKACDEPTYSGFIRENCRKTCNKCTVPALNYTTENHTDIVKPTDTVQVQGKPTVSQGCVDKKDNCFSYDDVKCLGIYEPWARANCAYRCGYCPDKPPCEDTIATCNEYGTDMCTNQNYASWVRNHCRKFCDKCDAPYKGNNTITPVTPTSASMSSEQTNPITVTPMPTTEATTNVTPEKANTVVPSKQPTSSGVSHSTCYDIRSDCADFGEESCFGVFAEWAIKNCARRCGYCDNQPPPCHDYDVDCAGLPETLCTALEYRVIAATACRKFCGFCQDTTSTSTITTAALNTTVYTTPVTTNLIQTTVKPTTQHTMSVKSSVPPPTTKLLSTTISTHQSTPLTESYTGITVSNKTAASTLQQASSLVTTNKILSSSVFTPSMALTVQPTAKQTNQSTTIQETTRLTIFSTSKSTNQPTMAPTTKQPDLPTTSSITRQTDQPEQASSTGFSVSPSTVMATKLPTSVDTLSPATDRTLQSTVMATNSPPVDTVSPATDRTVMSTVMATKLPTSVDTVSAATDRTLVPTVVETKLPTSVNTLSPATDRTLMSTDKATKSPPVDTVSPATDRTLQSTAVETKLPTSVNTLSPATDRTLQSTIMATNSPSIVYTQSPATDRIVPTESTTPSQRVPTIATTTKLPVCNTTYIDRLPACCKVCACPGEELVGSVMNSESKPLPKTEVYFSGCDCYRYLTDDNGTFNIKNICVRDKEIFFSKYGYMESKMLPVKVGNIWKANNILVDSPIITNFNVTSVLKRRNK